MIQSNKLSHREAFNQKACDDPVVGDVWDECFHKVAFVVKVTDEVVVYTRTMPHPADAHNSLAWDYKNLVVKSRQEFRNWLTMDGKYLGGKTWCDVHRGCYLEDIPPESEWGYAPPSLPKPDPNAEAIKKLEQEADRLDYSVVKKDP